MKKSKSELLTDKIIQNPGIKPMKNSEIELELLTVVERLRI